MSEAVCVSPTASTGEPVPAVGAISFEEFVAARSGALWRSAWLLTGDAQKAEDLLQTALVKAWRNWGASLATGQSRDMYGGRSSRRTPTGGDANGPPRCRRTNCRRPLTANATTR